MKNMKLMFSILVIGLMTGCGLFNHQEHTMKMASPSVEAISKASAVIVSASGSSVKGLITFTQVEGGVKVVADIEGLEPNTKHGFHIHQFGDLSSADGTAMGGHFNPAGMEHSSPTNQIRHVGDMGNIDADGNGKAHLDYVDSQIMFSGPASIIGRGVVVHAKEDDLKTQPTGNAGARIGQGVIGVVKP